MRPSGSILVAKSLSRACGREGILLLLLLLSLLFVAVVVDGVGFFDAGPPV